MNNDKLEQAINLLIDVNRESQKDYGDMQSVFARIEGCWSYETSYYDEGYDDKTEHCIRLDGYYQCATTTALLYNLFGGQVMQGETDGRRHYWLKLNGVDVDITRRQFDTGTVISNIKEISEKELITDDWMWGRYNNLSQKYWEAVKKEAVK